MAAPLIETADCTNSSSDTAQSSWAVSVPSASAGDLLIFCIGWDDNGAAVSSVTAPTGPNGETLTSVLGPQAAASTEVRGQVWRTIATGSWSAGTRTFTPAASESWRATVIRVPAGEFDSTTPIGAANGRSSPNTTSATVRLLDQTLGSTDGGSRLVAFGVVDQDPVTATPSGWTTVSNADIGTISTFVSTRDTETSNSESIDGATFNWTITGDGWATISFVVRKPSGLSVSTGLAEEADSSQNLGRVKIRTAGRSDETETAVSLSRKKILTYFAAVSGHLAFSLTRVEVLATQVATETDSALALSRKKIKSVGFGTDYATAFALARGITKPTGLAIETDSSLSLSRRKIRAVGLATSQSTSLTLGRVKFKAAGLASQTNTALNLSKRKIRVVQLGTETASAFSLSRTKSKLVQRADSSNTALNLSLGGAIGLAISNNVSLSLNRLKTKAYSFSQETDSALAPIVSNFSGQAGFRFPLGYWTGSPVQILSMGLAAESDSAIALLTGNIGGGFRFPLRFNFGATAPLSGIGTSESGNVAYSLNRVKIRAAGLATEQDIALDLSGTVAGFRLLRGFLYGSTVGQAIGTGLALSGNEAIARPRYNGGVIQISVRWAQEAPYTPVQSFKKIKPVGLAISGNVAYARTSAYAVAVGLAVSGNEAVPRTIGLIGSVGVAQSENVALPLVKRRVLSVQLSIEVDEALIRPLIPPIFVDVGLSSEVDTAFARPASQSRNIARADEVDIAEALVFQRGLAVGLATEIDSSVRLARTKIVSYTTAQLFNTALTPYVLKTRAMGLATEVDSARGRLIVSKLAQEMDTAQFQEIRQGGDIVFPRIPAGTGGTRMWTSFVA